MNRINDVTRPQTLKGFLPAVEVHYISFEPDLMHISDIYSLGETIKALVMLLTPISIIHIALSNKRRHCFFYSIRVKSRFFLWISWQTTLTLLGVCWYNERHLKFRLFSVASLLVACARDAATDNDILWRIHNKKIQLPTMLWGSW